MVRSSLARYGPATTLLARLCGPPWARRALRCRAIEATDAAPPRAARPRTPETAPGVPGATSVRHTDGGGSLDKSSLDELCARRAAVDPVCPTSTLPNRWRLRIPSRWRMRPISAAACHSAKICTLDRTPKRISSIQMQLEEVVSPDRRIRRRHQGGWEAPVEFMGRAEN